MRWRTWTRISEFLDRRSDAFLNALTFVCVLGAFYGVVYLIDSDRQIRRVASELQDRTTPPGGQVIDGAVATFSTPGSWILEFEMPWDAYCQWVIVQLRSKYAVTRTHDQVIEAVRHRFRYRYSLRIEVLEENPTVRVRATLSISGRRPKAPATEPAEPALDS